MPEAGDGVTAIGAPRVLFIGSYRWQRTWLPLRAVGVDGLALTIEEGWRCYMRTLRRARAWAEETRPDVLLTDGTPPVALLVALLAWQLGVPVVYRIRGIGDEETLSLVRDGVVLRHWHVAAKYAIVHPMYGMALRVTSRLVADCRTTCERLRMRFPSLADRIGWAHTPCEPLAASSPVEPLVLSATNLHCPRKFDGLLRHWDAIHRALDGCPEVMMRICGDGMFRRAFLRALARRRVSHRIAWVGHAPEFRQDLSRAVCLLHLSDMDSYPSVILEARAAGCPVISNDVGGVREMIDDGVDGFILRSPEELPDRLARIVRDEPLRRRMAAAGRARLLRENNMRQVGRELLGELRAAIGCHTRGIGERSAAG